jgi:hypothetical protein
LLAENKKRERKENRRVRRNPTKEFATITISSFFVLLIAMQRQGREQTIQIKYPEFYIHQKCRYPPDILNRRRSAEARLGVV